LPDPLEHGKSRLTEYSHNLTSIQLKKEYKEVKQIRELSGFGWDADKHVVTAADDVWDAYIEVCCVKKFTQF
jgi:Myb/SANT-like DNA-binding domain